MHLSIIWLKDFLRTNYLFVILAISAFIVHFAFLAYPNQTIFDEIYFGKFAAAYFNHQYYFDIHPPLGKLIIAGWAKLMNFDLVFNFDKIGEAANSQLFFTLRFLPALFGSLFVLLFSWFAYLATRSRQIALIAGVLILLDNAFLVQSKIIAIDIFLVFFEILTFCFFLLYQKEKIFSKKWFAFLALTGVSFGLTVSIKWTGLATIGVIVTILLIKIISRKMSDWLSPENHAVSIMIKIKEAIAGIVIIFVTGFLIYLIPFYIHFDLLTKSGQGDAFMSAPFQSELKNGKEDTPDPLNFWEKFIELNATMYGASAGLTATHPFSSVWNEWPSDKKPIYYWYQAPTPDNGQKIGKIYFLGNPVLWGLAFGAIALTLILIVSKKERQKITPFMYLLVLAYFANILPFIGVKRVAFLYHYLLSATFAILLLSIYLEKIYQKDKEIFAALLILIAISFAILTPLSYGWPMTPELDKFEMGIIDFLS
ncbi:MAG: phospholipid carrier-dependent glycosyltransferase [bacterium]|nr:phospholipid carrier-dependent glycosyltransferase [bacterium]